MLLRHALEHRVAAARQVLAALFFSHFSTLVLVVVSLAQWGTLAWLLNAVGKPPPLLLHLIGPLAVHTANRRLMVRLRRPHAISGGRMLLLRGYAAAAFTSLFCAVFLLGSAGVWMVLRGVLGALTVEAGTLQPLPTGSTLDEVFRWLSLTGVGTIALAFAYGYTFGQRRLTVTHIRLPLNVPPALHGLRIAQISDIHIGHNLNVAQVARFVRRVNELEPDLICITGDIADGPGADLAGYLPQLGQLRARHGAPAPDCRSVARARLPALRPGCG